MNEKQILKFKMEVYKRWNNDIIVKAFNEGIQMGLELDCKNKELITFNLRNNVKKKYAYRIPKEYQMLFDSMLVLGALTGSEAKSEVSGFEGFQRGELINVSSFPNLNSRYGYNGIGGSGKSYSYAHAQFARLTNVGRMQSFSEVHTFKVLKSRSPQSSRPITLSLGSSGYCFDDMYMYDMSGSMSSIANSLINAKDNFKKELELSYLPDADSMHKDSITKEFVNESEKRCGSYQDYSKYKSNYKEVEDGLLDNAFGWNFNNSNLKYINI